MKQTTKRRSVLNKQSVTKKKKKKNRFPILSVIRWAAPVFLKGFVLLVMVVGTSVSLMYGYHYLIRSPHLKLEQVDIAGVDGEIKRELIAMCDLSPDQNLLFLNLNKLKQKMEEHPWVSSVKLDRRFPHTLFAQVEKHRPFALVVMDGIHYMNPQGEIFKEVNQSDEIDFPVITGISKQDYKAREQLQRAAHVMNILKLQKGPWSLVELSEIHVKDEEISLYFNHLAVEINVMCNDLSGKMNGLKKVTNHLQKTGQIHQVICIDLKSVDGAVVSFRKS